MLRSSVVLAISILSFGAGAQTPPADPPAAAPPEGATPPAEDDVAVPPLPPPAGVPAATSPSEPAPAGGISAEDAANLKAQIKAELEAELKAQLQNEMEAAARDAATQKAAAQEWEEEKWVEEVKPTLNFLELNGYFRTRFDLFYRLDLGTFDPSANNGAGRGTSSVPPPTYYRPFDGEDCGPTGEPANFPGDRCVVEGEENASLLSMNMRLRLDPTLNVSDDIRIRSTVDVLDNLVFGSTPTSMGGNPSIQFPFLAESQNPQQLGLNSIHDAIRFKRVWAEVMTPLGQLRFGRMPQHFGLGVLANDGNRFDSDYGDNADQVVFATRVAGHYIVPGYAWSSSGPFGRGGGAGIGGDNGLAYFPGERGQRYNLDPLDDVHTLQLVVAKRDKEEDIAEQLRNGGMVFNYGVYGVYRTQQYDIPAYYNTPGSADINPPLGPEQYVERKANIGMASFWARFQWEKLKVEAEIVGIGGLIGGTSTVSGQVADPALLVLEGDSLVHKPLIVLQGGGALESSYKLLNDQLTVGLDAGFASGDDAFGFGMRPALNQNPQPGDLDGRQYGDCLEQEAGGGADRDGNGEPDCLRVDDTITNFTFNPDFHVDLILFREILGTVTDAFYVKPHIGYNLTENLGARLDVIYSQAMFGSSTPGGDNPLGVEMDISGFYGTDDGFYLMAQYGFFLPFSGFAHRAADVEDKQRFSPQFAQTFQLFGGVQF